MLEVEVSLDMASPYFHKSLCARTPVSFVAFFGGFIDVIWLQFGINKGEADVKNTTELGF